MKIILEKLTGKAAFGFERYKARCEISKQLIKLRSPRTTFELEHLEILRRVGFEIELIERAKDGDRERSSD